MERQIVLTRKIKRFNKRDAKREIHAIGRMLPYIESFDAFYTSSEVLDVSSGVAVTNIDKLTELYRNGTHSSPLVYIVGRN
jgi:hypothetical protein